ncbi:MAG TPA: DUF190 domain-containing protein [Gemmatimonadaceae bacterium]
MASSDRYWHSGWAASSSPRSHDNTFKVERLSLDLPIVMEIVDTREKIEAFLAEIDPQIREGLATAEDVDVRFYRSRQGAP